MSRQKSWRAIRESVHSSGRNHLAQRYAEKKKGGGVDIKTGFCGTNDLFAVELHRRGRLHEILLPAS